MKSRKIIFIITTVIFFLISRFIQKKISINKKSKRIAKIEIINEVIDFGNIKLGSLSDSYIIYKNIGGNNLLINDVSSTCGCTVFKWSKQKLASKKTDTIFIKYSADNIGFFSKTIYIFSNAKSSPNAIYLKGLVEE